MNRMKWQLYMRLMRFHKPVGIVLLWVPTASGLWIANHGMPPWSLLVYFLLGTILMRAAGCIMNDIADRHIDKHVARTKDRPLTLGAIDLYEAMMLLGFLLFLSFLIVLQLPILCFYEALCALGISFLYPFCKRFIDAPQCILGLAFSMGIPMAFAASHIAYSSAMFILMLLNFFWIIAYDTTYALIDRVDDKKIGVRSTAILFEPYDMQIIFALQMFSHLLWLYLAWQLSLQLLFYIAWLAATMVFIVQEWMLIQKQAYLKAFSLHAWYGCFMWLGLVFG